MGQISFMNCETLDVVGEETAAGTASPTAQLAMMPDFELWRHAEQATLFPEIQYSCAFRPAT